MDKILTGKELLDAFFRDIKTIPGLDPKMAEAFAALYEKGKFTETNVSNTLSTLRGETPGQNK